MRVRAWEPPAPGWRTIVTGAVSALVIGGCGGRGSEPPPTTAPPPPVVAEVIAGYIAEAEGTVTIEGEPAPGRLEVRYDVAPDGTATLLALSAAVDDVDLPVAVLGWPVTHEPLRCTQASLAAPVAGELRADGRIHVAGGAAVAVVQYASGRKPSGECSSDRKGLEATNPVPFTIEHDPDGDRFALAAQFAADHEGDAFVVGVDVEGTFVNRPPVAAVAFLPDGSTGEAIEGCPPGKTVANAAEGFVAAFESRSSDPDGNVGWNEAGEPVDAGDPKFRWPRADLHAERWTRSGDGGVAFIGHDPMLASVTFATGEEHWIALEVRDRSGAQDRITCRFTVVGEEAS